MSSARSSLNSTVYLDMRLRKCKWGSITVCSNLEASHQIKTLIMQIWKHDLPKFSTGLFMHSSITWLYTHSPCPLKWVFYWLKQYLQVYRSTVPPYILYMQFLICIFVILLDKGPETGQIFRRWTVGVLPNKVHLLVWLTTDCNYNEI